MDRVIRFQTSRGRDAIFYDGYSYWFDRRAASGDIFWRCLRDGCYGRLQTNVNLNQPMVRGDGHLHARNPEEGIIRPSVARMRERAATENTPIPQIYQEEANRLSYSASASALLPMLQSIDSALYRARRSNFPPLPRTLSEIVIPQSLQSTESGEEFVLLQLQDNNIMVFGAPSDFDVLCSASHVYMDGTFAACPELFRQFFTIHAFFGERQKIKFYKKQFDVLWPLDFCQLRMYALVYK
ncbi:hypothetical protein R1sor_015037 [Riccia sorocarpa]|uniref:FLYWCH-type domain-containing protein n=1 Tax=Riccia sorocarpa TaxID=122646 RepID=A0ABD3HB33_9MARC